MGIDLNDAGAVQFGFAAGFNSTSRPYDRGLGGGGIMDVGGYPVWAPKRGAHMNRPAQQMNGCYAQIRYR